MTCVGIVNYGAGNIRSIRNAFEFLGRNTKIVTDHKEFQDVTHLVLPGVGAFAFCMQQLEFSKMLPALEDWAVVRRRPLLGICVGMQLMAKIGHELGTHAGLNWLGGTVAPLVPKVPHVRVPHVGWNEVNFDMDFGRFSAGDKVNFYFDHSFGYFEPTLGEIVGTCAHGLEFAAIIRRENVVAAQFHPEKSQDAGLRFLEGFVELSSPC